MAIKHEPEKIVSRQESGPTVRQPKPAGDAYPEGFGLCGAHRMLVDQEMEELAKKLMRALTGDVVPVEDIKASLLKTGSAFMVLSVDENGVFSRIVDPETWQR